MSMQVQEGVYVKFVFSGDDVTDAFNKAVQFAATEGEVELADEDTTTFIGLIVAVDPGKTTAEDGDNVNVCTEGVLEAIADGAISYGDALGVGEDGKLKAVTADGTEPLTNSLAMVGRALQDADDGDVFQALIHSK
jgi:hypothetical protein